MSPKLKVDTRVTVETPEGVDFQFVVAGPGKRSISFLIDMILKLAVILVTLAVVGVLAAATDGTGQVGMGFFLLTWFAMSWLYGSCCEAFLNGQTLGKKSQKLRVVRTNGTPIGWFEAFGRNLLLVPDSFLVLGPIAFNTVGLLTMVSNRRMQRLGDLVFDTMVIDESREYISRAPGITQGVERISRSECRGRFTVPERTLAVIERLFEGDRLISEGRREEIARNLSLTLRTWLGYEDPGPDAVNPNTYFAKTPQKHTTFLRRVLKTFADDGPAEDSDREAMEAVQTSGRRPVASTAVRQGHSLSSPQAEAGLFESSESTTAVLDDIEVIDEGHADDYGDDNDGIAADSDRSAT